MKKTLSFIVNKKDDMMFDVRKTHSLNGIPKENTLAFLNEFAKFYEFDDTDEIEIFYEDELEEKDIDKVLHQIYYLMKAYWYGSRSNVNDVEYNEWASDMRCEYQNNPNELLKILEDYKRKVMEEM